MLLAYLLSNSPPTTSQPDFFTIIVTSIIALIAAVLGAFVGYWLTQRQGRKQLAYNIISDTPILGTQKEIRGKVTILFDKVREVKDLRLAIVEVQNTGRVPIIPEDFKEPLIFSFSGQTEVLDTDIVEVEPDDLKPVLKPSTQSVLLEPLLLNKNDRIRFKILANGLDDEIKVNARIVGIVKILSYGEAFRVRQLIYQIPIFLLFIFGIALFCISYLNISFGFPPLLVVWIGLLILIAVGTFMITNIVRRYHEILR